MEERKAKTVAEVVEAMHAEALQLHEAYLSDPKEFEEYEPLAKIISAFAREVKAAHEREISEVAYAYGPAKAARSKAPDSVAYALEGLAKDPACKAMYEVPDTACHEYLNNKEDK